MSTRWTVGLPRMHKEAQERRDFLPDFVAFLVTLGFQPVLEHGYGAGMGFEEADYRHAAPEAQFVSHEEVYQQDYVLVIRYPTEGEIRLMRPGTCLITMVHYPTRPDRRSFLHLQGLEAISLDSIKDDTGRRLVENLKSVAWNGLEVAFQILQKHYPPPGFESPHRLPIHVTLMGAGAVGSHAVHAAIHYGDPNLRERLARAGVPGVQVTVLDYDVTPHVRVMLDILRKTDLLVDATQRPDASRCIIPNEWISHMPEHAVLLDLSVDPYECNSDTPSVKGIEGIPQGDLNQYVFEPDDPAFDALPSCIDTTYRRTSVSCYSWPGIHPRACMETYGRQIAPVMRTLSEVGGVQNINPQGNYLERAIARAMLSRW